MVWGKANEHHPIRAVDSADTGGLFRGDAGGRGVDPLASRGWILSTYVKMSQGAEQHAVLRGHGPFDGESAAGVRFPHALHFHGHWGAMPGEGKAARE